MKKTILFVSLLALFIVPSISVAYTQQDISSLFATFQKILKEFALLTGKGNLAAVGGASPICEATGTGKCYYVSNKTTSGAGTFADPFGMADFRQPSTYCNTAGVANSVMKPGDYMYFRGGQYTLPACSSGAYYTAAIHPKMSGTPSQPITFKAYPGETPILSAGPGGSVAVLSTMDKSTGYNYIRFMGFTVKSGKVYLWGSEGSEFSYNDVEGKNNPGNTGTNVAVHIQDSKSLWIHHNDIYGSQGSGGNNAGIQVFRGTDLIVEDNYIHDNIANINDKESGVRNLYRKNYLKNANTAWYGNNQPANVSFGRPTHASYSIYENVIDGHVDLHFLTDGAEIHDNLFLKSSMVGSQSGQIWNSKIWNNVVISPATNVRAYREPYAYLVTSGPTSHFGFFDNNFYTASPVYEFGQYAPRPQINFDLSQMQSKGFETNSKVVLPTDIYVDQVSYQLKAPYTTAGRYGDAVGPDNVAEILDLKRYGPLAMPGVAGAPSAPSTPSTPAPAVTLSVSSSSIISGSSVALTWSSTDATTCTASGGWSGAQATSGTQSLSPISSTTYTLICTGVGGTDTKSVTVNVTAGTVFTPTVSLLSSSSAIVAGSSATLTWSSTNATSCTASGGWSGTQATSGSQSVTPTSNTTYTITCGGVAKSVTVNVTAKVTETPTVTVSLSASSSSIVVGSSTTLTWSSTNTTSCTASGGWEGVKFTSGSQAITPTKNTTYTITCGGVSKSVTVNVTAKTETPVVTEPQQETPAATYVLTQTLRRGSRGIQVTTLQTVLNKLGYLSDTPTGYFGVNTENAVKAFQREKGIASSGNWYSTGYGMVGAKTRSALLKAVAQ